MPRVPIIEQPSVATRPASAPYQRLEAGTGGRELARGLDHASAAVGQVANEFDRQRQRANQVRKTEDLTEYTASINTTFYGASDAQDNGQLIPGGWGIDLASGVQGASAPHGFLQLRGKKAAEHSRQALEHLRKRREEIAARIENPAVRAEFMAEAGVLYEQARLNVERHVGKEFAEAEAEAQQGLVEQGLTAIAAGYNDEDTVETHFRVMADALRKGQTSDEDGRAKVAKLQAAVAATRLDQYLAAGDHKGAAALFERSQGVIGHKEAARYRKAIAGVKQDVEAEKTARSLIEIARGENGRVDAGQALESITAVPEGVNRDEVQKRVEHLLRAEDAKWRTIVDQRFSRAFSTYLKTETLSAIPTNDRDWLIDNEPEKWRELQDMERRDKAARGRGARRGSRPGPGEQNFEMTEFLHDITINPSKYADPSYGPEAFNEEWGTRLTRSDYDEAAKKFAAAKKEDRAEANEFGRLVRERIQANPTLRDDKEAGTAFGAYMGARRRQFISEKKRPPTFEELSQFEADAWRETVTKRYRLGFDALKKDDRRPMFQVAIPPAERAEIENAIRAAGRPVTEDLVRELYILQSEQAKRGD